MKKLLIKHMTLRNRINCVKRWIFLFLFTILTPLLCKSQVLRSEVSDNGIDEVIQLGKEFLHKPYRYKGSSPWPMDCSGYLAYIFMQNGVLLPRNSRAMAEYVIPVKKGEVQKGDLLFFKGRNIRSRVIGHVGMVLENKNGVIKMLNSSSSGIVISTLTGTDYFSRRFVKAGRIPDIVRREELQPQLEELPIKPLGKRIEFCPPSKLSFHIIIPAHGYLKRAIIRALKHANIHY